MKATAFHVAVAVALPAALLVACGKQEAAPPATAPAPVAAPATPAPASRAADGAAGQAVYAKTCAVCHATAVAGAPKLGDKANWAPRIAQGKNVLYKHALEGFTGAKGMMPPRGGAGTLSDGEVTAAVDYMVDAAR